MNFARVVRTSSTAGDADLRVSQYDWTVLSEDLSGYGCAVIEKLLSPEDCQQIAELYPEEGHFRGHVQMARHGFGIGSCRARSAAIAADGHHGVLFGANQIATIDLTSKEGVGHVSEQVSVMSSA